MESVLSVVGRRVFITRHVPQSVSSFSGSGVSRIQRVGSSSNTPSVVICLVVLQGKGGREACLTPPPPVLVCVSPIVGGGFSYAPRDGICVFDLRLVGLS